MRTIHRILLFAGCLCSVSAAVAQPFRSLTTEEAVAIGLERSPLLRAASAEAAEARAAFRAVRAQRLPSFSTQASYTRLSSNIPEIEVSFPFIPGLDTSYTLAPVELNRYYARVSVEQPLFTGFRLHNSIRAAGYQAEAASLSARQEAVDVALLIRQAYWRLYQARALQEVAEQALDQVEAHLRDVQNRREVGTATQGDVLVVQTRRSEVRLDRLEADNAVRLARMELNRLTGLPMDTVVEPVDTVAVVPVTEPVEALVARALEMRPGLAALAVQVEASDASVAATQGAWLPEVALTGRYVYARPNQYFFTEQDAFKGTWEAGVSVAWRLWDGGQRAAETEQARARRQQVAARLAYAREQVYVEVMRPYLEVQRAVEATLVADQGVEEAGEALRVQRRRYAEGAALSSEVLDAELAYRAARSRRAGAHADYAVARAALLHALGQVQ